VPAKYHGRLKKRCCALAAIVRPPLSQTNPTMVPPHYLLEAALPQLEPHGMLQSDSIDPVSVVLESRMSQMGLSRSIADVSGCLGSRHHFPGQPISKPHVYAGPAQTTNRILAIGVRCKFAGGVQFSWIERRPFSRPLKERRCTARVQTSHHAAARSNDLQFKVRMDIVNTNLSNIVFETRSLLTHEAFPSPTHTPATMVSLPL
jgi:hypothetical protein